MGFDDRVQVLVGADDAVDRAGLDAQCAADAPVLVDDCQGARPFDAVSRIEWQRGQAGECGQATHTLGPARGALVDARFTQGNGLGVAGAIRKAAARALRLRQEGVDLFGVHDGAAVYKPEVDQAAMPLSALP